MSGQYERVALLTPYSWTSPNPVNEHVAELASSLVALRRERGDDSGVPDVLVVAPTLNARARRVTRRALRDLARGHDAAEVLSHPALRSGAGPACDAPVLAIGVPIGAGSVALRSSLRLLFDRAGIDLLHVHDPLASDLTRAAMHLWQGLTAATFHELPTESHLPGPLRDRVVDPIDLWLVPDDDMRAPLASAFGGSDDAVHVLPTFTRPPGPGAQQRTSVVIGRADADDEQVREVLRSLRGVDELVPGLRVVLLGRWGTFPRPSTPRWLRGRLHSVHAPSHAAAAAVLQTARAYVALPGTPDRAVREAAAAGARIVRAADAHDAACQVRELLACEPDASAPVATTASAAAAPAATPADDHDVAQLLPTPAVMCEQFLQLASRLLERRHPTVPGPPRSEHTCVIDLHMHTSHSWDCATDPEALLYVARKVGLNAVAVTDHNEISGALACAELAGEYGIQVIVGEEIKTAQGEVIGLFMKERIEPGLGWHETLELIRQQDALVYVPHPFDRLHTIPDSHTLRESIDEIDAFEVYNARLAFEQYNRDALRFARKYNLIEGAGSDAHVPQGLGTAAVHMPAWDDPETFLTALRQGEIMRRPKSLLYLQGLKLIDTVRGRTKQTPATRR